VEPGGAVKKTWNTGPVRSEGGYAAKVLDRAKRHTEGFTNFRNIFQKSPCKYGSKEQIIGRMV